MSQPVKLSDSLVLDARIAGEIMERSIAGQVEFWARLGKSVDLLLEGAHVIAMNRSGSARPLLECLESVSSPEGQRRLDAHLASLPFPHYAPHPEKKGFLIRTDAEGNEMTGRFINREFHAASSRIKK